MCDKVNMKKFVIIVYEGIGVHASVFTCDRKIAKKITDKSVSVGGSVPLINAGNNSKQHLI